MDKVIDLMQYPSLAVAKIDEELRTFKGNRYAEAVKKHVASTLKHFCEENARFAEVVYKTQRTLSDCCEEIMAGCGSSISDIDVYRGAVRSYFPNADIDFHMTITINGDAPSEEELARKPRKTKAPRHEDAATSSAPAPVAKPKEKPEPADVAASKPVPKTKAKSTVQKPRTEKKQEKKPEIIQLTLF